MTNEEIISKAYRLIRRKANDIIDPASDEILGAYTRGIVDLQTELWDGRVKEAIQNDK